MAYVITAPQILASAAADVEKVGSAISAAYADAARATTGLLPAAADEVSAAIAALFGLYSQEYQAIATQAAAFHSGFTQMLAAAGNAYAAAEAANAAALSNVLGALTAPMDTSGGSAWTSMLASASANPVTALIMGGTSNPEPDPIYQAAVNGSYIQRFFPGANFLGVMTPEQFWPVTPQLGNLTFAQSVARGVTLLNDAINTQLSMGNNVVAFGYSQSAAIVTNEINALMAMGSPHTDQLSFMMIGNPNNPDGGLLSRFPGFYIPFLDVPFNGATPPNSPYPTTIFTAQYDGIAHAPQYPLNVVSDLNAFLGYFFVHNTYPALTAAQVANAVPLPTSPGYTGNTQYYMLMTQDLPLLDLIRAIPYAGPPIADIFQPDLRVLVDLGYAGYGPGGNYADIPTPAGLFSVPNPFAVLGNLALGAVQGPYGAAVEIGVEAGLWGPEWFPDTYPWVPSINPGLNFYFGQPQVTALSLLSGGLGDVLHLIPPILN
ncbi:PE family protein [Mycobacterium haemophilum]|uniref:PE family protein n=1 Tax=Mycobacterium haemophilum TaxID=29311 RepID=A0A0I9XYB6_9MYCO|nr:PE-PPE domain-containing protein [Mycobacterium haemophilum]KLO32187.1 PE family protein [Mycobacterium haemophilum]KLO36594.1 PE family protein [Mycobacterium haemophilum]KLO42520.1 PE family protein [Mycobacterium haemophilum]KLO55397.1 PE family protein [Mycobacterium haemophilum]